MKTLKVTHEGKQYFVDVEQERPLETLLRKFCDKVDAIFDECVDDLEAAKEDVIVDMWEWLKSHEDSELDMVIKKYGYKTSGYHGLGLASMVFGAIGDIGQQAQSIYNQSALALAQNAQSQRYPFDPVSNDYGLQGQAAQGAQHRGLF